MTVDRTTYFVTRMDEMRARMGGAGPSSIIPTIGAATTVIDQYRTFGIGETNIHDLNIALIDIPSVRAVSKLAEGGFVHHRELEAAEVALQALLLHDIVHVITHAPKIEMDTGSIFYERIDRSLRTEFSFDLFQVASSRDWLIAPEYARVENGRVVESSMSRSPIVGRSLEEVRAIEGDVPYWNDDIAMAINAVAQDHNVPLYLSDERLTRPRRDNGFARRFYHRMRLSWNRAVGDTPPIICTFHLPPLLAIVLNRLNNRADLKSVIQTLRAELQSARSELHRLNELVTSAQPQGEIERQIRLIDESFDAIVPESRLSSAERQRRTFGVVFQIVRPIVKFIPALLTGNGVSYESILQHANNVEDLVLQSRRSIDRTVTAGAFAGIINTESIQSLVRYHFSDAEIAAIERSLAR